MSHFCVLFDIMLPEWPTTPYCAHLGRECGMVVTRLTTYAICMLKGAILKFNHNMFCLRYEVWILSNVFSD